MPEIIKLYGQTAYFEKEQKKLGPLCKKAKKRLVHLIVDWTIRETVWLALKDYPIVFEKIQAIFPRETLCMYFIPKEEEVSPSGLLYNHFRRRHSLLHEETGICRNQKTKKEKKQIISLQVLPSNIDLIRQRLISRSEPWSKILEDWKNTFEYRRNEVLTTPLADIFNRWPKYKNKKGMEMVIFLI